MAQKRKIPLKTYRVLVVIRKEVVRTVRAKTEQGAATAAKRSVVNRSPKIRFKDFEEFPEVHKVDIY
jgi:hypothetical protein